MLNHKSRTQRGFGRAKDCLAKRLQEDTA
ncbi:unnamed protein product [Linum tenue]|uniref:Uncharacterized protein n=1 Tax=Linum tenue TaxID=586396 RepID=A0AAV0JBW0_9ROSI|nr:unnamed protein product [Linum tenue]